MLTIGLTGGIASGKSLVSQYFKDLNIDIVDSDKIAKDLFKENSPHLKPLKIKFGDSIFIENNNKKMIELDRKALGKIVFSDPEKLTWLNNFTHPLINAEMKKQLSKANSDYVILDIPLLITKEGVIPKHLGDLIDKVLVIRTTLENQIERVIKRDYISEEQALNIINSQSSLKQKLLLADDVIDNNTDQQALKEQIKKLHQKYLSI